MITVPLTLFIMYLVFGLIELIHPAEDGHSFSGKVRNIGYTIFLLVFGGGIVTIIYDILPFEPRVLEHDTWWTTALIVLGYIAISDFFFYWYHRLQHSVYFLFQIHELHHADTELNSTSSLRSYWLERPIQTLVIILPSLFIIGVDKVALLVFPIVTTIWLLFTHANVRINFGFLTPILCGPQLHRIHHSILPEHVNKNFAQFFPVYDVIFGTYYRPKLDEYPSTGTRELAGDAPFSRVLAKPFRVWWDGFTNWLHRK